MQERPDIDELVAAVAQFDEDACFNTKELLKDSVFERTELIEDNDGSLFIRKYIRTDTDKPHPYQTLVGHTCPTLPKIYSARVVGDTLVVRMEFLEGVTLRRRGELCGPMNPAEAARVLEGVVSGLSYLHEQTPPLIHRDVNPGNIIISAQGGRLIDFGIARQWNAEAKKDTHLLGTEGYAAPEQFGFSQTSPRSDVFGLGNTLRFMLAGGEGPLPRELSKPVSAVVAKATAFDPAGRFSSANELLAALRKALAIETASRLNASSKTGGRAFAPTQMIVLRVLKIIYGIAAAVFAILFVSAAFEPPYPGYACCCIAMAMFWCVIPYLVIANPFGVRQRSGLFKSKPVRNTVIVLLACAIMSVAIIMIFAQPSSVA